jgi:hypothetical protein
MKVMENTLSPLIFRHVQGLTTVEASTGHAFVARANHRQHSEHTG